jgi:hypothetical protein
MPETGDTGPLRGGLGGAEGREDLRGTSDRYARSTDGNERPLRGGLAVTHMRGDRLPASEEAPAECLHM